MTGLAIDDVGFELVVGDERIGPRRLIEPADVALLNGLADRYVRAVREESATEFADLARRCQAADYGVTPPTTFSATSSKERTRSLMS